MNSTNFCYWLLYDMVFLCLLGEGWRKESISEISVQLSIKEVLSLELKNLLWELNWPHICLFQFYIWRMRKILTSRIWEHSSSTMSQSLVRTQFINQPFYAGWFLLTWHKLELLWNKEPQLRKCPNEMCKPFIRILVWQLMWETPGHCVWCHHHSTFPGCC